MKLLGRILLSTAIATITAIIFWIVAYILLYSIFPTRDEQGHSLMPIFQFFMSWIIAIIVFSISGIFIYRKTNDQELATQITSRFIMVLYAVVSLIFIFDIVISFYGYSFSGYYSDKILNWVWLAFTIFIIIKFWKTKRTKMYFFSLLGIVLLSLLPMAIPFVGIINYFTTLDSYRDISFEADYRMELRKPLLSPKPTLYMYEYEGVLEKEIANSLCGSCKAMESVTDINPEKDDIQFYQLAKKTKDSISVGFLINTKPKIYTFPINNFNH